MLDTIWMKIVAVLQAVQGGMDQLLAPVDATAGPAVSIFLLAVGVVLLTSWFGRFKTRRYRELEGEFWHWFHVRQAALEAGDGQDDQKSALAKNIDKAKLNEVYYNYFFEGLLNNLLTRYIPIMLVAGYINTAYRPEALMASTGQKALFALPLGSDPVTVGGVFWYVCCLGLAALLRVGLKRARRRGNAPVGEVEHAVSH
ncbi:hypothetical protein [Desulfohalobium retbaense]|uniref:Uncharacterized protein n=1 Tax=Desulfohalobium retbaense (strain ATCC 49708 / DSM 5692 / JCM 16813 / HR100) TaxID=485915 RepID=C8X5M4_DESRD|nr:hypothetical protein [Desulfohalobium retbaense]ACV69721.1 conserved hypothetical protein [Desulfohalobium retbaense DSM 5692]